MAPCRRVSGAVWLGPFARSYKLGTYTRAPAGLVLGNHRELSCCLLLPWLDLQPVKRIEFMNQGRNVKPVFAGEVPRVRVVFLVMAPAKWYAGEITRFLPYAMGAGVARVNRPRFQAHNAR